MLEVLDEAAHVLRDIEDVLVADGEDSKHHRAFAVKVGL